MAVTVNSGEQRQQAAASMVTNQRITASVEGEEQNKQLKRPKGEVTERLSGTNFKDLQEEGNTESHSDVEPSDITLQTPSRGGLPNRRGTAAHSRGT